MDFFPTLFIGAGQTGNLVLRQIKKNLLDRTHGMQPESVQFLWIGTRHPERADFLMADLDPAEELLIEPDASAIAQNIDSSPDLKKQFSWWTHDAGTRSNARLQGRMAYFWETQFKSLRRLTDRLGSATRVLTRPSDTALRVFLFASVIEPDASMLFDLAAEIRSGILKGRVSSLLPWLFLTSSQDIQEDEEELSSMRYAFIREMSRYMLGSKKVLDHGRATNTVFDRILFDRVFLYDHPAAFSTVPAHVAALTERSIAERFNSDILSTELSVDEMTIATTRGFEFILPSGDIHRYCAARLAQDCLFFGKKDPIHPFGLTPLASAQTVGTPKQEVAGQDDEDITATAKRFLRDELRDEGQLLPAYPFSLLSFAAEQRWPNRIGQVVMLDVEASFHDRLMVFLNNEMNRPELLTDAKRQNGTLKWAGQFLTALSNVIEDAHYTLAQNKNSDAGGRILFDHFKAIQDIVRQYQDQVKSWERAAQTMLAQQVNEKLVRVQTDLNRILAPSETRKAVLPDLPGIESSPGAYFYRELIPLPQGREAIERLRSALKWQWVLDARGIAQLFWCMRQPADDDAHEAFTNYSTAHLSSPASGFVDQWMALAMRYSRFVIDRISLTVQMSYNKEQKREEELLPLLSQTHMPSARKQAFFYILGIDQQFLQTWSRNNALSVSGQGVFQSSYPDQVNLIHLELNLPVTTAQILIKDRESYRGYANYHVFPAEQAAGRFELEIQRMCSLVAHGQRRRKASGWPGDPPVENFRFSAGFTSLMADPDAFDTLMKLVFLNWIVAEGDAFGILRWVIRPPDGKMKPIILRELQGENASLEKAIHTVLLHYPYESEDNASPLFSATFRQTIHTLNNSAETALRDKKQLKAAQQEICRKIQEWGDSGDPFYKDLAVYQSYLYLKTKELGK